MGVVTSDSAPRWLSEDEQQAWRAYLWAGRELDVAMARDLAPLDISLAEYELISMLSEAPEHRLRMSVLAEQVVQSRSRVTHTASRLERRGWVRRTPADDDGRGVVLCLTREGLAAIEEAARVHVASVRRHFMDLLTPAQVSALGHCMQTIRDAYSEDTSAGLGTLR